MVDMKMAIGTIMATGAISDGWKRATGSATNNCKGAKVPLDRPPGLSEIPRAEGGKSRDDGEEDDPPLFSQSRLRNRRARTARIPNVIVIHV